MHNSGNEPHNGPRKCIPAALACAAALAFSRGALANQAPVPANGNGPNVTLHATRLSAPIRVDGRLDDLVYTTLPATGGFLQQEPHEGELATEQTEVWVTFDDHNVYVSARCWDSHPERMVDSELRRDGPNVSSGDNFVVVFDTFHDKRNGFYFQTNPAGAIRDQSIVDEQSNDDWNTVWEVKVARFSGGWTTEMAIPFKSLRFAEPGPQRWGINFRRQVKSKNESSYLTAMPAAFGPQGILKMVATADLLGLETPARYVNLEVKPYATTTVTTDRTPAIPFSNKPHADAGFDFKYGLTRGLTADATVNTDFAQIEEDLQQVNLTRFNLFFPEKRDFFLEGQGIFLFGAPPITMSTLTPGDIPVMFFSRRIGLNQGQSVPVRVGGRITGKAGRASIGALNIQTGDKPSAAAESTNFSVARVKFDVLRRSSVGFIATNRSPLPRGSGSNRLAGADASFLFFRSVAIHGYYSQTQTTGLSGNNASYRGIFDYSGDRYGLIAEHLAVDRNFNPEVGYVQRTDFARSSLQARFSPRPRRSPVIRKLTFQGGADYITDAGHTSVQNRQARGLFQIDFQNSDVLRLWYMRDYELLPRNFGIAPGVVVPAGANQYDGARLSYTLGQQRKISGTASLTAGSFYDGTKRETSYSGRIAPIRFFAVEPSVALNWIDLPFGSFDVTQIASRFVVTPSPSLLVSSLVQFSAGSHSLSSSVRLHWEYQSGSDLYVVYSDGRDTAAIGFPDMLNRSFAVKVTRLVRF